MAAITLDGHPARTNGELPAVGEIAPAFRLVNGALEDVGLGDFPGKKKVIGIMPSLATGVCARSARAFDERVAGRGDAVVLVVSADLPFAQGQFCETAGLDGVVPLSMMRSRDFARDYGVLIMDGPFEGLAARAVVVTDERDVIRYAELVPEIGSEPDYDAVLAALD